MEATELHDFVRWDRTRTEEDVRRRNKVMAAGGLAKTGPNYQRFGVSRDAAQRLCEAFGWAEENGPELVERVCERVGILFR